MNDSPLISILVPSRRIKQLEGLIDSLNENTKDKSRIDLIVKCDDDLLDQYRELLTRKAAETGISIRWISTPRLFGVFTMWINTQLMWRAVKPGSYFVFVVTDEGRFVVKDWEEEIAQYKGYYPDDIFRLRLSVSRDVNYYNINQAICVPDCFPVFTRRWLEITEGFGDCWGSDTVHESIAYHLGRGTGPYYLFNGRNAIFRDLVLNKRLVSGIDEFAQDLQPDEHEARSLLTCEEWKRLVGSTLQHRFSMLARRLLLEIKAHEMALKKYKIDDDKLARKLTLYSSSGEELMKVSYSVPFWFTSMAVFQFMLLKLNGNISPVLRFLINAVRKNSSLLVRPVFLIKRFTIRTIQNRRELPNTALYNIMFAKGLVRVDSGSLYKLVDGKLAATDLMLENIRKAKFVNCSPEDLTHWVEVAYSDTPIPIETAHSVVKAA